MHAAVQVSDGNVSHNQLHDSWEGKEESVSVSVVVVCFAFFPMREFDNSCKLGLFPMRENLLFPAMKVDIFL